LLAATQFVSAAAPAAPQSLLAISSTTGARTLLHVDARTLAPVDGRTVPLEPLSGPVFRSPDKSLLAVPIGRALTFVDTVRMESIGTLQLASADQLSVVAWPTLRRLFALSRIAAHVELLVIDPIAQSVIARSPLPEGNSTVVTLPNGMAYLAWPYTGIAPSRVVVVGLDGTTNSVTVDRIRAGIHWHLVKGVQVADISQPGLTADPTGGTAYLVGATGLVAEINLPSLSVTYRALTSAPARRLARVEKALNGPTRYAKWLGEGRIAVGGTDAKTKVLRKKSVKVTWAPAGVAIVDTRTWQSRMIDPTAGGFAVGEGTLLLSTAHVVNAYETDGTLRFSTAIDDKVGYAVAFGGYEYVWGEQRATILDLQSGAVVAAIPNPHLYVIGADD